MVGAVKSNSKEKELGLNTGFENGPPVLTIVVGSLQSNVSFSTPLHSAHLFYWHKMNISASVDVPGGTRDSKTWRRRPIEFYHCTTHSVLPPWVAGALVRSGMGVHGRAPLPHVRNNDMFLLIEVIKSHCLAYVAGDDAPFSTQFEVAVTSCGGIFNIIIYKTIK